MANTLTLSGTFKDANNNPLYVGQYVVFRVTSVGTDVTDDVAYPRDSVDMLIDSSGDFSGTLWNNGFSGTNCVYEVRDPSGQRIDVIFPDDVGATVRYEEMIELYQAGGADPQLPVNSELFMQKSANLSDVADVPTSRTNLGLGTAATTASTDYATAAQGTKADSALQASDIGLTVQAQSSVLDATTASYTSAEQTKLSGIEEAADVTDATNIAAAGGYVAGGTDVPIEDGGTGASTEAAARTNLEFQSNVTGDVTPVTVTSYTVLATDHTLTVDDTAIGGNVTINLPAAATATSGFSLTVKKTGSTHSVTIDGDGAETIDGNATYALTIENESVNVICDGTGWNLTSDTPPPIETTITDTDLAVPTSGAVVGYAQPISQSDVWTFSSSTTSADPGGGNFRLNNGTQSSSTEIYISKESKSGESHDFSDLVVGSEFRATEAGSLNGHTFEATGSFTDNTTWISVPVTVINSLGSLGNNKDSIFQQVFGAASFGNQRNLTSPTTLVTATSHTVLPENRILLIDDDTAGGDVTISLPAAAVALDGWSVTIKKLGSTADVILETDGSETIDGDLTRIIRQKLESTCLVSDGSNWRVMFPTTPTGWAVYDDSTYTSGSPLIPSSGVRTQLTIDGLGSTTNTDFLPAGVADFWDTTNDKITPQKVGDAYDIRVDFTVDVPANTESILLELDIGDGSPDIPIIRRTVAYSESGAGQSFSVGFPIFALDTFLANGGKLYVTTSAVGFDIYDISVFIKRDFSPL